MSNDISYVIKVADDFSSTLKKYQSQMAGVQMTAEKTGQVLAQSARSSKFFTQNLIDLGKATGIYVGFQQVTQFAKGVFQARVEMDGLQASLAAIMPKFDKTKSGTQLAAEEIDYLREATNRLGVSFQSAAPEYMKFLASSKQDLTTTRKTFEAFSGLSRIYGLSTQRFGLVINALQQIQGKGVVNMEELKLQLGDSLPNAMNLFADAAGVSSAEFYKLVHSGRVGAGILKLVAENIEKKFGKDMVAAAQTLGGKTAVLGNQWYYLKTVLSDAVAPALSNVVSGLGRAISSTANFFAAFSNAESLNKLSPDLRVLADAFIGLGEAIKFVVEFGSKLGEIAAPIIKILSATGQGIEDFGTAAYLRYKQAEGYGQFATSALWGGENTEEGLSEARRKISIANDAAQEFRMQRATRDVAPQVNITVNKAAPDTTIEVKKSSSSAPRTGNTVGGTD